MKETRRVLVLALLVMSSCLLAALVLIPQTAEAAGTVVFAVTPNTLQIEKGQSFTFTVLIESGGVGVASGHFEINYDPSLFTIASFQNGTNWNVTRTNASTFSFMANSLITDSSTIASLLVTPVNSTISNARLSVFNTAAQGASGAPLVAVPSEKNGFLSVSTNSPSAQGLPLEIIIPAAVAIALIPALVYYFTRKPKVPDLPNQQDKDDDKKKNKPDYTTEVLRKEDLVSLRLEFFNFKLEKTVPPAKLIRIDPVAQAYMAVEFQGQNIAERAFFETAKVKVPPGDKDESTSGTDAPVPPPVSAILAGPTRLVFRVPATVPVINYSLPDLLNWSRYEPSVVPVAVPAVPTGLDVVMSPQIRKPTEKETAIEVPYRLVLSPSRLAGWVHSVRPVSHDGWTELWHTRLGIRRKVALGAEVDEADESERIVRAVWSPDYSQDFPPDTNQKGPFRMPMTARDRHEVVRLTSDFSIVEPDQISIASTLAAKEFVSLGQMQKSSGPAQAKPLQSSEPQFLQSNASNIQGPGGQEQPALKTAELSPALTQPAKGPNPVRVKRLMLSTLGAWIDARGAWDPPPGLSVMEWVQRGTQARDHYVKVVYKGYLFPFGHRASLVKVTERKFVRAPLSGVFAPTGEAPFVAYLRQRMYIVVLEHDKDYGGDRRNNQGRDWPFQHVRVATEMTPNIDDPSDPQNQSGVGSLGLKAFWPRVLGKDFTFHMVADDVEGQRTEFDAPLVFVMNEIAFDPGKLGELYTAYPKEGARREVDMSGQKVAFAKSAKSGDTTLETSSLHLGHEKPNLAPPKGQPYFYPTLAQYDVNIPSLSAVLGVRKEVQLNYDATFLSSGWDQQVNVGEVFASLLQNTELKVDFPSDKVGGLANPNMSVKGLSRKLGPVGGDLPSIKAGNFDPSLFFKDALKEAKILGISLLSVIDNAGLDKVPKFITETVLDAQGVPKQVKVTMTWQPRMKDFEKMFIAHIDRSKGQPAFEEASLSLSVTIIKNLDSSAPTVDVVGYLKNFEVHLIPAVTEFIVIRFDQLSFEAHSGKKITFGADINDIQFVGALSFINALQQYIPLNGFDPPSMEVTPQGVRVGFDLGIPSVGFGVFSLQNINLSASLNLPFTGEPIRVRFAFCERHRPFLLTVSIFGGGGFFAIALGPDKVEMIEGSLEFGGNVSIDIGIASGGLYVMAGVYFKLEDTPQGENCQLTGYLRCGGALEVLGLVCISAEFYMALNYQSNPKRLWGEASLTVEIEVAFFSKSVSLTVQREFASSPPPTFEDQVPELRDWSDYCEAFGEG